MYNDYRYNAENTTMERSIGSFIYRVYGWMAAALAVSASVAYWVSTQPGIMRALFSNTWILIGLFVAQIGLVVAIGWMFNRLSYSTAVIMFMVYAALLGLTLSSIFLIYTMSSIALTFVITAGMFGCMCLYGYITKADLSTMGSIMTMALFGLIIAMLVNMYFKNQMADYIISGLGVVIFCALTAYDMQKIKQIGYQLLSHEETMRKAAILGALTLYLDFINLFLFLLRFFGARRD